jgi:hypothetical protein
MLIDVAVAGKVMSPKQAEGKKVDRRSDISRSDRCSTRWSADGSRSRDTAACRCFRQSSTRILRRS